MISSIARASSTLLLAAVLAGCAGSVNQIAENLDRSVMQVHVGRDYASLTTPPPRLFFEPEREPIFGEPIGSTRLSDGSTLHRHLTRSVGESASTDFLGIVQTRQERITYRLMYFKVDADGRIVDTANGRLRGEASRCVGYIGGVFTRCEDPGAIARDIAFFDANVRTSDGRPLSAWGAPADPDAPG